MQEKATIARPYARAAFEQARAEGKLKEWSAALQLLAAVVAEPAMRRLIGNPKLGEDRLFALLVEICGSVLPPSGRNFVQVLVRAGRLEVAPEIHAQFEQKRAAAEGVAGVEVVSAYELDAAQKQRIIEIMKKRLGREIRITATVDQSIIGGAVIRAGDSVIDASLRGRLRQLGNEFAK